MPENIQPSLSHLVVSIDTITLDPCNSKTHSEQNIKTIAESLTLVGQTKPVVLDASGICRAGNGLIMAARSLGWKNVAAIRVNLSQDDAIAYGIMDNRASDRALGSEWDVAILVERLSSMDSDLKALLGWNEDELKDKLSGKADALDLNDSSLSDFLSDGEEAPADKGKWHTCHKCNFRFKG